MRPQKGTKSTEATKGSKRLILCAFCAFLWLLSAATFAQDLTPTQLEIQKQQQRLGSSAIEERRDALMRLGSMRLAAASRVVLPALKDVSPMVRATAAKAILSLDPEVSVGYLLPLLNDKDEFVRRETAYALGLTHSRSATAALSERLLSDKEDSVRGAAAIALGQIGDEAAVVPLVRTLEQKQKPNMFVLRAAASALGQIKSRAGIPALIAALANEKFPSDVRREAARSLGLIGDPSAASALKAASTSEDPYLSQIAYEALKRLSRG
jgi:HEAT repeat protein